MYDVEYSYEWCKSMWVLFGLIFASSNFYWLDLHNTLTHQQKWGWKLDLPSSSHGYRKCIFVDFLIEYMGFPSSAHYWVWSSL